MSQYTLSDNQSLVETRIPARLDCLPWSRWHWLVVIALGVTWILDGLQIALTGALGAILKLPETLGLTESQIGAAAGWYLFGAVLGALFFGYATDRFGRKRLFFITLSVYLSATALTGLSWDYESYAFFHFMTGAGIGGEYAAINSAIDELLPARLRGRVDLMINCTYWIGAIIGAIATILFLNPDILPTSLGWRLSFLVGASLGLVILYFRHWVPESPRWLITHGRGQEAEAIVTNIEQEILKQHPIPWSFSENYPVRVRIHQRTHWQEIWQAIVHQHRSRSILSFVLMSAQAFFYNAIFFTYALVLVRFYQVPAHAVSWYILPFAAGNVLGPMLLGRLFDTIGRKPMIATTYAISGSLLIVVGWLFTLGVLSATTQSIAWTIIFFFASSAASSAYLTVGEIFPLEIRALAIAIFYAAGTLVGGVAAPWIFAGLIETGSRSALSCGYLLSGLFMILAAILEVKIGVKAERKSLEAISALLPG